MAYSNAPDTANTNVTRVDLQLADTATAGALTPLLAASTGSPVDFTATSTHAVYMTDLPATGSPVGTLRARPVAGGGVEVTLAQNAALARVSSAGAKVVFIDNIQGTSGSAVTVDIEVADLAGNGKPAALVKGVDVGFDLDASNVYFTVAGKGLYFKTM
jgi:hypothetical protein